MVFEKLKYITKIPFKYSSLHRESDASERENRDKMTEMDVGWNLQFAAGAMV